MGSCSASSCSGLGHQWHHSKAVSRTARGPQLAQRAGLSLPRATCVRARHTLTQCGGRLWCHGDAAATSTALHAIASATHAYASVASLRGRRCQCSASANPVFQGEVSFFFFSRRGVFSSGELPLKVPCSRDSFEFQSRDSSARLDGQNGTTSPPHETRGAAASLAGGASALRSMQRELRAPCVSSRRVRACPAGALAMWAVCLAFASLAAAARTSEDGAENMNGKYTIANAGSPWPTDFRDYPGGVESFDYYHGPITSTYGQVSDLPCKFRREGGSSLVIGGPSLVTLEGKACNPL